MSTTRSKMFYGSYEFEPAPLMNWGTELITSQNETLGLRRTISLDGVLIKTLAGESGNFDGLMAQRDELHDAVVASGQEFKITFDGTPLVSGIFPVLQNIEFAQGTWTTQIPYSITFEYEEGIDDKTPIDSFDETWEFQENEDKSTYVARHNINVTGLNTAVSGNNNALENARTFALTKTGYDKIPPSHPAFVEGLGSLSGHENLRTESVDVRAGSISLTEEFTVSSGAFTHQQNASFNTDENDITTVQVDGSIQGLGRHSTAFANALNAYNSFVLPNLSTIAQDVYNRYAGSGSLVTSSPRSISVSQTEKTGRITYSRSYDDALTSDLPPEIQDASVSVQKSQPVQLTATIPIPDRTSGPIVQNVGTTTPGTYTINGTITGKTGVDISVVEAYAQEKINENLPTLGGLGAQTLTILRNDINTDELKRTVTFNVSFQYTSSNPSFTSAQQIYSAT